MTHDTIVVLAALGLAGQMMFGALILIGGAAALGVRAPLRRLRDALWGDELRAASGVSAIATGVASFGHLTIPTVALAGFVLLIGFLLLSTAEAEETSTSALPAHA